MTNQERMANILHFKHVDRLPAVHFGYWNELLTEWAEQKLIPLDLAANWADGNEADIELNKILGWDFNWSHSASGNIGLSPLFEYKELEKTKDGFIIYQNGEGLIERKRDGANGIPSEVDYLLKDRKSFEELFKPKMCFNKDRINYEYFKKFNNEKRDEPICLFLGSILGSVRNMFSMVGLSYTMCDDYDLLKEVVDTFAEMQYKCAEEVLKTGAKFDFAHYWEDICFTNGPLLSPTMFDDLCAKHYKKRNELVRSYGIDIISLDCDGVTNLLLPVWFNNGVNTMFPLEVGTWGDQFAQSRAKFGKELRGVGGMDKTAFRKDKKAVDIELARIEKIVELGGFIPCPDHRIMPGSKFDLVKYYVEQIKNMKVF